VLTDLKLHVILEKVSLNILKSSFPTFLKQIHEKKFNISLTDIKS